MKIGHERIMLTLNEPRGQALDKKKKLEEYSKIGYILMKLQPRNQE